jgi:hypothetical protein
VSEARQPRSRWEENTHRESKAARRSGSNAVKRSFPGLVSQSSLQTMRKPRVLADPGKPGDEGREGRAKRKLSQTRTTEARVRVIEVMVGRSRSNASCVAQHGEPQGELESAR